MAGAFTWGFKEQREISSRIAQRKDIWLEQEADRRQYHDGRTTAQWRADVQQEWTQLMEPIVRRHVEGLVASSRDEQITRGWVIQKAIQEAKPVGDNDAATTPTAYHITLRPDQTKTTFADFYLRVQAWLAKARFNSYHTALEQKATAADAADLGKGYHAHIVAHTTCLSQNLKKSIMRQFGDIMAPQACSIMRAATPDAIVRDYLLLHKSQDGHKEATKDADAAWRTAQGLAQIYTNTSPMSRILRQPYQVKGCLTSPREVIGASAE